MTECEVIKLTKQIKPGYALDIYFDTIDNSYVCAKFPTNAQIDLGDNDMIFVARVLWPLNSASLNKAKEAALERISRLRLEEEKNGNQH